ncbi:MAG: DUF418 domain-containing protein [candidate division Zixibacteria bacterium]|nr:DUF418 domain-containing protein [candidate division Zixibacteria bacterium]
MVAESSDSTNNSNAPQTTVTRKSSLSQPVTVGERINSIDVLRGVAVLGILAINIEFFALPGAIIFNPSVAGGFAGINLLTWEFGTLLFFEKMMAIFSMLFGAGLILMYHRAEASGRAFGGVYYRRLMWLLIISLAHGYLLWYGDILFPYAICGLVIYLLRRRSARLLIILGVCILSLGILTQVGAGVMLGNLGDAVIEIETARENGETLTPEQEGWVEVWAAMNQSFNPSPEEIATDIEAYQSGFLKILTHRAPFTLMMQTQALIFMIFWRVAGLMLLGMGLMKLGVFSAQRSLSFYTICIVLGYGIGLPLVGYGMGSLIEHNFDFIYRFMIGNHFNYVGSIMVALAHVGVVMILCKKGWLTGLTRRLAAVGRMALSNYLTHTIICTTIFYGYGLGLFGQIERFGLFGFVVAIWILQLVVSPIWLKHFLFGPAEWVWRSLTYWQRQPMKVE